jgi:hypothetical protein
MKYVLKLFILSFCLIYAPLSYAQLGVLGGIASGISKIKNNPEARKFKKQVGKNEKLLLKKAYAQFTIGLQASIDLFEATSKKGYQIADLEPEYTQWQTHIKRYISLKTAISLPLLYEKEKEVFQLLEFHKIEEARVAMESMEKQAAQIKKDILPVPIELYTDSLTDLAPRLAFYTKLYEINLNIQRTYDAQKNSFSNDFSSLATQIERWERLAGKQSITLQQILLDAKCMGDKATLLKTISILEKASKTTANYENLYEIENYVADVEKEVRSFSKVDCQESAKKEAMLNSLYKLKTTVSTIKSDYAKAQEAKRVAEVKAREDIETQNRAQSQPQNNPNKGNCGPNGVQVYRGPRGGCYYLSGNSKVYVDRSCCQ